MPKGYTTKTKIENFLLIEIDPSFNSQVDDWIDDIERFIDELTGRNFVAEDPASARLFGGDGTNELEIDDCVEVTKVELGSGEYGDSFSLVDSADYILLPANAVSKKEPIKVIHLKNSYFTKGIQNHRITAKWGYSESCPGDVSMAATILAAHIWKFGRGGITDGVAQERIGNYSVTYKSQEDLQEYQNALAMLDHYKSYRL